MKKLIILGSTGSIGTQTLEVINDEIKVIGLSAKSNIELLIKQIKTYHPAIVCFGEENEELKKLFPEVEFVFGDKGLVELAGYKVVGECSLVNALVGSVGLLPTLKAIETKKTVLLANKETLVIGGKIVKEYLQKYNGVLYPIDSEHSAIWELIDGKNIEDIAEITITASGGAFVDKEINELENVTKEEALKHPSWVMGSKITIDSATMMNKGFEVIEAHYLFDVPVEKIKTIINRLSICHAIVKWKDNSVSLAIAKNTMKGPIAKALYYPKRVNVISDLELLGVDIKFEKMDLEKYPCLGLAYEAISTGGLAPTVLNAANEVAVKLFLAGKIKFLDIYRITKEALMMFCEEKVLTVENIMKYDIMVKDYFLDKYNR